MTTKMKTENVSLNSTVQHLKTRVQEKTDEIAQFVNLFITYK